MEIYDVFANNVPASEIVRTFRCSGERINEIREDFRELLKYLYSIGKRFSNQIEAWESYIAEVRDVDILNDQLLSDILDYVTMSWEDEQHLALQELIVETNYDENKGQS